MTIITFLLAQSVFAGAVTVVFITRGIAKLEMLETLMKASIRNIDRALTANSEGNTDEVRLRLEHARELLAGEVPPTLNKE